MDRFLIGDVARLSVEVRDASGALVDPSTIAVTIKPCDGAADTFTPVRASIGSYYYDHILAVVGWQKVRWQTTGTAQGVVESGFQVDPLSF